MLNEKEKRKGRIIRKVISHEVTRTDGVTDEKVYIDNIHTDTSICSYYAQIDGVMQDTMDDRIHNSLILGFSISDTNSYRGINQIEGQNDTFVKGFASGYNGYHSASITEQRFLESDFLKNGVYANKISSNAIEQITWAVGVRVLEGNSSKYLNPQVNATRADVSAMLYKYCTRVK